ncbi:hypothetical protein GM50_16875 [freshwater metagenome]|uniref:Uncharacterized protein n=1 Tax=freshwater metagenome TaxID=449393 RepID=A0A094QM18_9ZZZZ
MPLVSDDLTPPDLILKGSGANAQVAVLIILGSRQPIEDAIDLCAKFQEKGNTVVVTHSDDEGYKLPLLISEYGIVGKNIHDLRNGDDSDLVNAEFESIVSTLSLDESTGSSYLDQLEEIDELDNFIAPNPEMPRIKEKPNRIAVLALLLGPLWVIFAAIFSFDPFGIEPWPGLLATTGGLATLLYRWNQTREEGDDGVRL